MIHYKDCLLKCCKVELRWLDPEKISGRLGPFGNRIFCLRLSLCWNWFWADGFKAVLSFEVQTVVGVAYYRVVADAFGQDAVVVVTIWHPSDVLQEDQITVVTWVTFVRVLLLESFTRLLAGECYGGGIWMGLPGPNNICPQIMAVLFLKHGCWQSVSGWVPCVSDHLKNEGTGNRII